MGIKLWHDDVRPAPEGWVWARTNCEAIAILQAGDVTHASLDHDLGNHDAAPGTCDMGPGSGSGLPQKGDENGYHLVEWMVANGVIPDWVRIHSWNYSGGTRMESALHKARPDAYVYRETFREGQTLPS